MPCTRQIASMFAVEPPLTRSRPARGRARAGRAAARGRSAGARARRGRRSARRSDDAARPRRPTAVGTWRTRGRSLPVSESTCRMSARVCSGVSPSPPRPTICGSPRHSRVYDCLNRRMMASPSTLVVGDRSYEIYRLDELQAAYDVARLPYTLRVLLENVAAHGRRGRRRAVATWDANAEPSNEISFAPRASCSRTSPACPAVVDLAAMRDAIAELGGDPAQINPLIPAELVIDHSVQVDEFASRVAFARNVELEFERNHERYALPALGPARVRRLQGRAARHRHLPPGEPRVPRARRRGPRRRRVPGHARRHRLAHDDGQRARRARLGRRRDRGRGGDARRAALDARAAGRRLPARAAGCARARPRPTSCSR